MKAPSHRSHEPTPSPHADGHEALDWILDLARASISASGSGTNLNPPRAGLWSSISKLAYLHNLEGWAYRASRDGQAGRAGRAGGFEAPEELFERWEKAYFSTAAANEAKLTVAALCSAKLNDHQLRACFVKGLGHLARTYEETGLRPMADLDLACHPGDYRAVDRDLRDSGCRPQELSSVYHATYLSDEHQVPIEVHLDAYGFIRHRRKFQSEIASSGETVAVDGHTVRIAAPEAALAFEVAHFVNHDHIANLKHYRDFTALLRTSARTLNADRLASLLLLGGLADDYLLTVALTERLFPASTSDAPPAPARDLLLASGAADPEPRRLEELANEQRAIFLDLEILQTQTRMAEAGYRPNLARRLGYLARYLFPPPQTVRLATGSRSVVAGYWRHIAQTVSRSRRKKSASGATRKVSVKADSYDRSKIH